MHTLRVRRHRAALRGVAAAAAVLMCLFATGAIGLLVTRRAIMMNRDFAAASATAMVRASESGASFHRLGDAAALAKTDRAQLDAGSAAAASNFGALVNRSGGFRRSERSLASSQSGKLFAADSLSLATVPKGPYGLLQGGIGLPARKVSRQGIEDHAVAGAGLGSRQTSLRKSVDVFEVPAVAAAVSGPNVRISGAVHGSVVGSHVRLDQSATVEGTVTAASRLTAEAGARIRNSLSGYTTLRQFSDEAGTSLAKRLEAGDSALADGRLLPDKVSLFRGRTDALLQFRGDLTRVDADGVPEYLRVRATRGLITDEMAIYHPGYSCPVRIYVTLGPPPSFSPATVQIYTSNPASTASRKEMTPASTASFDLYKGSGPFLGLQLDGSGPRTLVTILPGPLLGSLLPGVSPKAVYLDVRKTGYIDDNSGTGRLDADIGVSLSDARALPDAFSLVTPNRVYLRGQINTENPRPFSVLATAVRFGAGATAPVAASFQGQVARLDARQASGVGHLQGPGGQILQGANYPVHLRDIQQPQDVPPVSPTLWMIVASDGERVNP